MGADQEGSWTLEEGENILEALAFMATNEWLNYQHFLSQEIITLGVDIICSVSVSIQCSYCVNIILLMVTLT